MWTVVDSPVGELRLVEHHGRLTGVEWAPWRDVGPGDGRPRGERRDDDPVLGECARQLAAYFAGDRRVFDLPLAPTGTPFQLRVWEQLRTVPWGETTTYGDLARRLGMGVGAARAVGLANGRNPIPIIVPCHRVIGADGSLTGFTGGLARKQCLLALEQDALF